MILQVNEAIKATGKIAESINEQGVLVVIAAAFIFISITMFLFVILDRRKLIGIMAKVSASLDAINEQNKELTLEQIRTLASLTFGRSFDRCMDVIYIVKQQNNIKNKSATKAKVRGLVNNIYKERLAQLDAFKPFGARKLSEYTDSRHIDDIVTCLLSEIYSPSPNRDRALTNLDIIYDQMRSDFFNNISK
jgi:hypothetical protein